MAKCIANVCLGCLYLYACTCMPVLVCQSAVLNLTTGACTCMPKCKARVCPRCMSIQYKCQSLVLSHCVVDRRLAVPAGCMPRESHIRGSRCDVMEVAEDEKA
jgi:hypothetical protein